MKIDSVVSKRNISTLIQRMLNYVDPRLMDHGLRVAYLASRMLGFDESFSQKDKQNICFLALLHDVGAYKTEEIDEMARFESEDIWAHSIYGYLFLYHLSPLKEWAGAVLYHHAAVKGLKGIDEKTAKAAQIIKLADRADMFWLYNKKKKKLSEYLHQTKGQAFRDDIVALFDKAEKSFPIFEEWKNGLSFHEILPNVDLSLEECEMYLNMMIFSIDFRSRHTVTHTITTTYIASRLAEYIKLNPEQIHSIHYGALLHDIGKIGIPTEILEFPGKLSPQAMKIMQGHVTITEEILTGIIHPSVISIAVRHHEKLDGTGYPRGLCEKELRIEEQVVAVADIVSALLGVRSYKNAYSSEKTIAILKELAQAGKINKHLVSILEENLDNLLAGLEAQCAPILETYSEIKAEYDTLLKKFNAAD